MKGVVVLRVEVPPEESVVHLGSYGSERLGNRPREASRKGVRIGRAESRRAVTE